MNMVNIKINDKDYSVPASYTILDAAREAGIKINPITDCIKPTAVEYEKPSVLIA